MTNTVRKNSKEYKSIMQGAHAAKRYDLQSYFEGVPCELRPSDYQGAKLKKLMDRYQLTVHSNLWYEWSAA